MSRLKTLLAERIKEGLSRKSILTASRWANKYRMMGHPYPGLWTFDHHRWLEEMHNREGPLVIGQKSAQVGFTEWALNKAFFTLDVKQMDVLYVLPTTDDASTFSAGRFDKAVELSLHLQNMFSDVQNVKQKRAGPTNMYIRGSNSRSGLKSIPVSLLILDELDEMAQENIPLATERLSGQIARQTLMLSTPTIPDFGINFHFNTSTQEHFQFKCPSCSKYIELRFPDNLHVVGEDVGDPRVEESYLFCNECKAMLPHEGKREMLRSGIWHPYFPGRSDSGFHINQLYACHLPPSIIAKAFLLSLKDPFAEQELWNSKLGLPHIVAGAKINEEMVAQCIRGSYRRMEFNRQGLVTMGVDPGTHDIHVEIDDWRVDGRAGYDVNTYAHPRVLQHCTVRDMEQLDALMEDFNVRFCIIDSQPERRKALEFANRWNGRVKLCRYPVGVNGRNITVSAEDEHIINVDRTSWLDMSLGRFKMNTIDLPEDTSLDYKQHIMAQIRIQKKDNNGNPIARYETPGNRHDHYGHARNYAEIALPFALGLGITQDIRG